MKCNSQDGRASNGQLDGRHTRRSLLTWAGSAAALSMLPACRRPVEKIIPSAARPEQVVPGNPLHYATAVALMGNAVGLLVETHEGRPTKVEGNPRHPESSGASSSFLQASVMQLYDAERSRTAAFRGQAKEWAVVSSMLTQLVQTAKQDGGASFGVLTSDHRSPTLAYLLDELRKALPEMRVCSYEPFDRGEIHAGCELVFGRRLEPLYSYDKADVVALFDADPLGLEGSPLRAARQWAARRMPESTKMNRWYAVESSLSITGSVADHRLVCDDSRVKGMLCALALELQQLGVFQVDTTMTTVLTAWSKTVDESCRLGLRAMAQDLANHRGSSLIVAGGRQPPAVHALAQALNAALGNQGATVKYVRCCDASAQGLAGLKELSSRMASGSIRHLMMLGCNPVLEVPRDLAFGERIKGLQTSIHVGLSRDETASVSDWHINQAHAFESWGDVVSEDGTASIVQPMIAPLFDGHTFIDVVLSLLGRQESTYDTVRKFWQKRLGTVDFERAWRRSLHDGVVADTAYAVEVPTAEPQKVASALESPPTDVAPGYELSFVPDHHVYDGRYVNNAWLHELPEPFTKVTWGNAARISTALARKYELSDGDLLALGSGRARIHVPIVIARGQATNTISLTLGQGRAACAPIARHVGYDAYPLRLVDSPFVSKCDFIERHPGHVALPRTQEQFNMLGRAPVRVALESQLTAVSSDPPLRPALSNPAARLRGVHRAWAMSIDLTKCIGCNACAVACQAENNVPVVGVDGVRRGRHMHWMRVDRYFEGRETDVHAYAQPVVCQQCEKAPCETVCPAGATSHSPDGLNDMVYNRCVGSRYCENNCPFKVRKFNYFEYWGVVDNTRRMQLNPDVTVRSRGVMEKCTFCVQRINAATNKAKRNGSAHIEDGAVVAACEQACPTGAIVFGDLLDPRSRVAGASSGQRAYRLLDELAIDPRVFYLVSVRNPNPEFKS
jgi:molybdopterin-containing oxidoreductase family iron-sulfur binding subunit